MCSLAVAGFAQPPDPGPVLDSLEGILAAAQTPHDSGVVLEQLARTVQYTDPTAALGYVRRARRMYARRDDVAGLIATYIQANLPHVYLRQLDSARDAALAGIALARRLPPDSMRAHRGGLHKNLATYYHMQGRLDSAEAAYGRAAAYLEAQTQPWAGLLLNRSGLYMAERRFGEALADLEAVVAFARDSANDRMLAPALGNAAAAYRHLGRLEPAAAYLAEAAALYRAGGDRVRLADTEAERCAVARRQGGDTVLQVCRAAFRMAEQAGSPYGTIVAGQALARVFEARERLDSALHYAGIAYEGRGRHPDPSFGAQASLAYADALVADGQAARALGIATEARGYFAADSTFYVAELAGAEFSRGVALAALGRSREAAVAFARSRALDARQWNAVADDRVAQAEVSFRTRETERALEAERRAREADAQTARAERRLLLGGVAAALGLLALGGFAYARIRRDRARIREQSAEREVMLREIHHRVKNNLQIISALMAKQARLSGDEGVQAVMREGQDRLHSMALIHQRLYQHERLSRIRVRDYVEALVGHLASSQRAEHQNISVRLDVDPLELDVDRAIPVGLILNELITNAFKYGFRDRREGLLEVSFLRRGDDAFELRVADDGRGLADDYEARSRRGLGLNLVRGLARQLGGTWSIARGEGQVGTTARVAF